MCGLLWIGEAHRCGPGHCCCRSIGYGASVADGGYFPAGESVLRRVHGERAVGLLYGQRALLMQATHPVAFTGPVGSTSGLDAPFERLVRTAKIMKTVYFCARAAARGGPGAA